MEGAKIFLFLICQRILIRKKNALSDDEVQRQFTI
jgi:hypothetical protein